MLAYVVMSQHGIRNQFSLGNIQEPLFAVMFLGILLRMASVFQCAKILNISREIRRELDAVTREQLFCKNSYRLVSHSILQH